MRIVPFPGCKVYLYSLAACYYFILIHARPSNFSSLLFLYNSHCITWSSISLGLDSFSESLVHPQKLTDSSSLLLATSLCAFASFERVYP